MQNLYILQINLFPLYRIPDGLDRSWEAKRVEGLEMLGHSVEAQKEKQRSQKASAATQDHVHKNRIRGKKQHTSAKPDRQAMGTGTNGMVTGGGHSGGGHRQLVLAEINQNVQVISKYLFGSFTKTEPINCLVHDSH